MHIILLSVIVCTIEYLPHRLRMSVSYSEAGAYVPAFSRFRIPLRPRRPHEPSGRPPCRPSPGAVEAGWHSRGISKRKGPPRVEKRAAKRGEHSDFHSFNDMILNLLHVFMEMLVLYYLEKEGARACTWSTVYRKWVHWTYYTNELHFVHRFRFPFWVSLGFIFFWECF